MGLIVGAGLVGVLEILIELTAGGSWFAVLEGVIGLMTGELLVVDVVEGIVGQLVLGGGLIGVLEKRSAGW